MQFDQNNFGKNFTAFAKKLAIFLLKFGKFQRGPERPELSLDATFVVSKPILGLRPELEPVPRSL